MNDKVFNAKLEELNNLIKATKLDYFIEDLFCDIKD